MPTKTFLNLPKEKQNIIIEASLKEFKRVLLKDASINKIITQAKISRGSFYTYFKDINDIYFYSINKYKKEINKIIKNTLITQNGNLIETINIVFDKITQICLNKNNKQLFKNIFLNFNYQIDIRNEIINQDLDKEYGKIELISQINKNNLNLKTEEELFIIIEIITNFVINGLIEIVLDNNNVEIEKEKLNIKLEILKKGIWKE